MIASILEAPVEVRRTLGSRHIVSEVRVVFAVIEESIGCRRRRAQVKFETDEGRDLWDLRFVCAGGGLAIKIDL